MVKFAIFVCALFAFGCTEVMSEETLETLQGKVAQLEVKTESNVIEAREKAAESLESLEKRAMEFLFSTVRSVVPTVVQLNVRFDILKNQTGDRNITECIPIQKNLYNTLRTTIRTMRQCLIRKLDEGYEFFRQTNRYREEAQEAVANLKEQVERCRTQPTPGCLNSVNQEYESVSNVRVQELLQNIANQEHLINNIMPSLSDCLPPYNLVSHLIEASGPALVQFRECLQNA